MIICRTCYSTCYSEQQFREHLCLDGTPYQHIVVEALQEKIRELENRIEKLESK